MLHLDEGSFHQRYDSLGNLEKDAEPGKMSERDSMISVQQNFSHVSQFAKSNGWSSYIHYNISRKTKTEIRI